MRSIRVIASSLRLSSVVLLLGAGCGAGPRPGPATAGSSATCPAEVFCAHPAGRTLTAECSKGADCTVRLDGEPIATEWQYGGVARFIAPLGPPNPDPGLFLLSIHAGDGCPIVYRLLHIEADGSHSLTEQFGNCNDFEAPTLEGEELIFPFPALEEASREAAVFRYSLPARALTPPSR